MARRHALARLGIEDRSYSIDEWIALEGRTGERFEYHEGRLVPWRMMAGGSPSHSMISANVSYLLGVGVRAQQHPAAGSCRVHSSDLQLKVAGAARYVYPDAAVVCGRPEYDPRVGTAIVNPAVVVEVLSPSSVRYDMGEKFDYYARLTSLRAYVLVAQDDYVVEVRARPSATAPWVYSFAKELDGVATIDALDIALPLAEVYRGVDLDAAGEEDEGEPLEVLA